MARNPRRYRSRSDIPEWKLTQKAARDAGKVPRGTEVVRHRVPNRTLRRLEITPMADGRYKVPVYGKVDGELRIVRYEYPHDLAAAIRQAGHATEHVAMEQKRFHGIWDLLRKHHTFVSDNWGHLTNAQRRREIEVIHSIITSISPRRGVLHSADRQKAIDKLNRSLELLEANNPQAAFVSEVGAANDIIERLSTFGAQKAYLPRREKVLRARKFEVDEAHFKQIDEMRRIMAKIQSYPSGESSEIRSQLSRMGHRFQTTLTKLEASAEQQREEIDQAAYTERARVLRYVMDSLNSAASHAGRSHFKRARWSLERAMEKFTVFKSRETRLYHRRFGEIAREGSGGFRDSVFVNQLKYFADNVNFHFPRSTPTERRSTCDWFLRLLSFGEFSSHANRVPELRVAFGRLDNASRARSTEQRKRLVSGSKAIISNFIESLHG